MKYDDEARARKARALFDPWADGARLGAGHARYNLWYAFKNATAPSSHSPVQTDAERIAGLEKAVHDWIKPQFQAAYLAQLLGLRDSVLAE